MSPQPCRPLPGSTLSVSILVLLLSLSIVGVSEAQQADPSLNLSQTLSNTQAMPSAAPPTLLFVDCDSDGVNLLISGSATVSDGDVPTLLTIWIITDNSLFVTCTDNEGNFSICVSSTEFPAGTCAQVYAIAESGAMSTPTYVWNTDYLGFVPHFEGGPVPYPW